MPLQGFVEDLYRDTIKSDEEGQYRGTGLGAFFLKPFVDEQNLESTKQQGAVKRQLTALGEDPADYNLGPGATVYDAQGAVATSRRKRDKEEKRDDRTFQTDLITQQQAPQLAQIEASTAATREANQLAREQGNQTHQLALMQLQDSAADRKAQLEYQKLRDRKEDMRYNERMEQLDRKDRQAMMQALAGGLASLGAAFAL